jgi:hypothetical protein
MSADELSAAKHQVTQSLATLWSWIEGDIDQRLA